MAGILPGMEIDGSGRLKDLAAACQFIEHGLVEIETALMSVDGLMPDKENQPNALAVMNGILQETKEIEENTRSVKIHLQNMLASVIKDKEEAIAMNKSMEDGLNEIEEILKPYGYDASKYVSEDEDAGDQSLIEDSSENGETSTVSIELHSASGEGSPSVDRMMSPLHVSMSGVEITPYISSHPKTSRTRHTQSNSASTPLAKSPVTPASHMKIPKVSPNPYLSASPTYARESEKKCKEFKSEQPKVLVKPERPVLSKAFHDIVGEGFYGVKDDYML